MGFVLTIEAENIGDLKQKLIEGAKAFGIDFEARQIELPLGAVPADRGDLVEPAMPAKRTRKVKEEKAVEPAKVSEPVQAEVPTTPPVAAAPGLTTQASSASKEDAFNALQDVSSKKGIPAVREVLQKFKANRFSEIPEKDFNNFIAECKAECAKISA